MKSTFSVIFYLKRQVVKKDGTVPVMGRITVDGSQTQFSCKLTVDPKLWDTTAEGYLSVFYYEKEEFLEKCRAAYPDAGLTELTQIEIVSRDAAEYVTKIKVAGETYDGEQFRHALELPSACFTITEMDDHVRIVARGMGHGFGLSQNTAEKLAKEGYGYREILAYFYKGAVIGQAGNL